MQKLIMFIKNPTKKATTITTYILYIPQRCPGSPLFCMFNFQKVTISREKIRQEFTLTKTKPKILYLA